MKTDLTDETAHPGFGAGAGNLGFSDVPLQGNGHQVFIKRAFLIDDTLAIAQAKAGVESTMAISAAAFDESVAVGGGSGALTTSLVPEPGTALLALFSACGISIAASRRRRI
jgi:hypothetical protein